MEKLNKWLTLGANLGVIAGLVFLAFQIRQNTSQMRADASFSLNQTLTALNSAVYQYPEFAEIYLRGCKSYSNLSEVERLRFRAYAFDMLNLYLFAHQLEVQGLNDIHTDIVQVTIQNFQSNPGLMEFLKTIEKEWAASDELYLKLLGN